MGRKVAIRDADGCPLKSRQRVVYVYRSDDTVLLLLGEGNRSKGLRKLVRFWCVHKEQAESELLGSELENEKWEQHGGWY